MITIRELDPKLIYYPIWLSIEGRDPEGIETRNPRDPEQIAIETGDLEAAGEWIHRTRQAIRLEAYSWRGGNGCFVHPYNNESDFSDISVYNAPIYGICEFRMPTEAEAENANMFKSYNYRINRSDRNGNRLIVVICGLKYVKRGQWVPFSTQMNKKYNSFNIFPVKGWPANFVANMNEADETMHDILADTCAGVDEG